MPSTARERSMISTSFSLPGLERCERPSSASDKAAGDQPGRLAQGPEEKHGLAGRRVGFISSFACRYPELGAKTKDRTLCAEHGNGQCSAGRLGLPPKNTTPAGEAGVAIWKKVGEMIKKWADHLVIAPKPCGPDLRRPSRMTSSVNEAGRRPSDQL